MAEIKSFREYIAEAGPYSDEFNKILNPDDEASSSSSTVKNSVVGKDEKPKKENEPEEPKEKEIGTEALDNGTSMSVTNKFSLTLPSNSSPNTKIVELEKRLNTIENTYNNLSKITSSNLVEDPASDPNKIGKNTVLNITHGKTCKLVYDKFSGLLENAKKEFEQSKETIKDIQGTKRGTLQSRGEHYANLKKAGLTSPSAEEEPAAPAETPSEVKEETIDEALVGSRLGTYLKAINPISRTNSGITVGNGNRYNTRRVLKTAGMSSNSEGSNFDFDKEKNFLDKAYAKYVRDTSASISKSLPYIRSDIMAARRLIDKYLKKLRLIKVSDDEYIHKIISYMDSAHKLLYSVGNDMEKIVNQFNSAMKKTYSELLLRTEKNKEEINSLNTKTIARKYERAAERSAQRKEFAEKVAAKIKEKTDEIKGAINNRKEEKDKEKKAEAREQKKLYDKFIIPIRDVSLREFNGLLKQLKQDFTREDVIKLYNNTIENLKNDEHFGNTAGGSDKTKSIDKEDHKRALARALLIITRNQKQLRNILGSDTYKSGIPSKNLFLEKYDKLLKKEGSLSVDSLMKLVKNELEIPDEKPHEKLAGDAKEPEPEKPAETEEKSKALELRSHAAKDFDGEEPQPKNIYAYAMQKAKKLQER